MENEISSISDDDSDDESGVCLALSAKQEKKFIRLIYRRIGFNIIFFFFVRLFLARVRVDGSNSDDGGGGGINHSHKWRRRPKSTSSVVNSISKTHSEKRGEKKKTENDL